MGKRSLVKHLMKMFGSAPVADPDGMVATVGGTAAAAGTGTLATGTITGTMVDKGAYTVAEGAADFTAAATGPDASVSAATGAIIQGADFVITRSTFKAAADSESAAIRSVTKYFAIDVDGWAPAGGTVTINLGSISVKGGKLTPLIGNVAQVGASASAFGDNSLADTVTGSLVVESQFSLVTGTAVTAIG
jgi:hypothetical protein